MLLLLGGAQLLLPGWLRMFVEAIRQYHHYTQNQSVLAVLFGSMQGEILGGGQCVLLRSLHLAGARRTLHAVRHLDGFLHSCSP